MPNVIIQALLFGFAFLECFPQVVHCASETDISRLRATILKDYDKEARPVLKHGNATDVAFSCYFLGMEFDEQRGMLTLHLLSQMNWYDEHVAWDPRDYGNLTEIHFAATELWKPDISVINNYYDNSGVDPFAPTPIFAFDTNLVIWYAQSKFQVGCSADYRPVLFRHTCKVYLSSWAHDGSELSISVSENGTEAEIDFDEEWSPATQNREWKLLSNSLKVVNQMEFCCPAIEFTNVVITLDIERRFSSHTAAVTVVGFGIAVTILISFWLNPFANERIPLMLLLMIVNAVYLQFMHRTIPNNGATVPLTICFFRDSLILVMYALGWTVMIRYWAKARRNSPVPLPDFVETLLDSFVGKLLCLNSRPQSKAQSQQGKAGESPETGDVSELVQEDGSNYREDWEWLARLCDRIVFFLYFIIYMIFISAFL